MQVTISIIFFKDHKENHGKSVFVNIFSKKKGQPIKSKGVSLLKTWICMYKEKVINISPGSFIQNQRHDKNYDNEYFWNTK